ncbi:MAG TPA: nuclear transport factor 2 family protein [Prolixibacteraceae bacterium]|jgi:ketosteroid isomerase-like protein|nr:nuclear transport factor 2 family protein [Prolixibacteraceae bacterium]
MENKAYIAEIYQSIDNADAKKFASYIAPNGSFRFANNPAVTGNQAIEAYVDGFFKSLKGINHSNLESWSTGDAIFVNGTVKYTRHNDTSLELPFSCTWKMKDQLIDQYLIFIDSSELYQ